MSRSPHGVRHSKASAEPADIEHWGGGCRGDRGVKTSWAVGDKIPAIAGATLTMPSSRDPAPPEQTSPCPSVSLRVPSPTWGWGVPGSGTPLAQPSWGWQEALGFVTSSLRSCASCEPASLEFAHEAGNQGRRRARASSGGGRERAPACGVVAAHPAGHRVPAADGEDVNGVGVLTAAARPWECESCSSSPRCHQVTGAGAGVCAPQRVPGSAGCLGQGVLCSPMWLRGGVLMGDHHCGTGSTGSPGGREVTRGAAPVLPVPLRPPRGGDSGRPAAQCPPGVRALPPHSPDPKPPSLGQNGCRVPSTRPCPQSCGKSSGLVLAHHGPVEDGFSPRCVCFWCFFGAVLEQTPPCPP